MPGNQGTLFEALKVYFADPKMSKTLSVHAQNDKGHGRIEQRIAYSTDQIQWLQDTHKWPGLTSIGMVHAKVIKKGKETEERRYYISSLPKGCTQA